MMRPCEICGVEALTHVRVPAAGFDFCRSCLHAATPSHRSAVGVLEFYKTKQKWAKLLRRFERERYVPPMEKRYVHRASYVLDYALRHGLDPSKSSLLDVGTAAGFFLKALGNAFRKKSGIDIDGQAVRYGADVLQQPVLDAELDDPRVAASAPYDVVTCFHVVEHVNDPVGFVSRLKQLTREGGLLFLAMPLIQPGLKTTSFYREFVGDSSGEEHLHHFSVLSAGRLAAAAGLHVAAQRVWDYKGRRYLPEILLAIRNDSHAEAKPSAPATRLAAWRMQASLVRWALASYPDFLWKSRKQRIRRRADQIGSPTGDELRAA